MQDFLRPEFALLFVLGAVPVLVGFGWLAWGRGTARRATMRRILTARVRSGVLPRNIPVLPGEYAESNYANDTLASEGEISRVAEGLVVNEQPVLRLKYINRAGQRVRCTMNVERVDFRKMTLIGCCNGSEDRRSIPVAQIFGTRMDDTRHRFDVAIWCEAVRVARRRRGLAV